MAVWDKVKIYYKNLLRNAGATLTVTSTESTGDFNKDYISNQLEVNRWQAEDSAMDATQTLELDLGVGNTGTADYFTVYNHNLNTAGVTIALESSATGAWAGEEVVSFTPEAVSADTVFHKEFSAPPSVRYWRIVLTNVVGDAPYISVASFGLLTELDFATTSYDPYQESLKQNVSVTQGGRVAGVHNKFTERKIQISFDDIDSTVYNKIKTFQDTHKGNNFFIGWETSNNPNDIWLVRSDGNFNNPLTNGGAFRNGKLSVMGRKEE